MSWGGRTAHTTRRIMRSISLCGEEGHSHQPYETLAACPTSSLHCMVPGTTNTWTKSLRHGLPHVALCFFPPTRGVCRTVTTDSLALPLAIVTEEVLYVVHSAMRVERPTRTHADLGVNKFSSGDVLRRKVISRRPPRLPRFGDGPR